MKINIRLPLVITNLKSNYCKLVFAISLVIGVFLVPKVIWKSDYVYLAIPFIILFALTMACFVRSIKEKIKSKTQSGGSIVGLIANILGISALQICGIASPLCGISLGMSILSILFPMSLLMSLAKYGGWIMLGIIILQILSLHFLGCLKSYPAKRK